MSIRVLSLRTALIGAAAMVACGPLLAADDAVVARVGSIAITTSEASALINKLDAPSRAQVTKTSTGVSNMLRAELGRRVVLDQAKKAKWDQRDDVEAQIARARDEIILATYLQSVATPPADFPSDADARKLYDANLSRFMEPRQFHLAQIYIAKPAAGATDKQQADAKARADQLDQKAKAKGADFAALAKASSDEKTSAPKGGDLGWIPENQLVPAVAKSAQGLRDDEVSDVIEAPDGWHIIRLLGTRPAAPRPYDDVKPQLVASLRKAETDRLAQAYVEKLLNDGHAAVNEIAVQQLIEPAGQ